MKYYKKRAFYNIFLIDQKTRHFTKRTSDLKTKTKKSLNGHASTKCFMSYKTVLEQEILGLYFVWTQIW